MVIKIGREKKGEEKRENKGIKKKYGGQNKIVLCEAKNGKLYHKYTIFFKLGIGLLFYGTL